jgi:hypothetical protein
VQAPSDLQGSVAEATYPEGDCVTAPEAHPVTPRVVRGRAIAPWAEADPRQRGGVSVETMGKLTSEVAGSGTRVSVLCELRGCRCE